ncbi:MAG: hypothetical protein ACRDL5_14490, partial [Solirubrobacteraceae bacterium]
HNSIPCSEIFDPRFQDIGIGVNDTPFVDTLALEFGLRHGQRQPSHDTAASTSCPHRIPKPIVGSTPPVQAPAYPTASGETVSVELRCASAAACVISGTLTLPDAGAGASATTDGTITIQAHRTATLAFTFTAAQVQAELSSRYPSASLALKITAPAQYTTTIAGTLKPA